MDIDNISDALVYLTGGTDPITTVKELSVVSGNHSQTIRGYLRGEHEPTFATVLSWHKFLSEQKDCHVFLHMMLPCNTAKRTNGKVTDEYMAIFHACTQGDRAYEEGRKQDFLDSVVEVEQHCQTLRDESEEL